MEGGGCSDRQFSLLVAQQGRGLRFELADALRGRHHSWSCLQLQAELSSSEGAVFSEKEALYHLSLVISPGAAAKVYVNGALLPSLYLQPSLTIDASSLPVWPHFAKWSPHHRLIVAPAMSSAYGGERREGGVWGGELYSLGLYGRALNASEVRANYVAGVRDSAPLATPAKVELSEDSLALVQLSGEDPFDRKHGLSPPV